MNAYTHTQRIKNWRLTYPVVSKEVKRVPNTEVEISVLMLDIPPPLKSEEAAHRLRANVQVSP